MTVRSVFLSVISVTTFVGCSPDPTITDTTKFLGKWTYAQGSTINLECNGTAQMIDLSKVPPANQPGFFTFSAGTGELVHEVDARGCKYDWTVSGDIASASPDASCANFPDGKGGSQVVHLQSGTKSTADGTNMDVDVSFTTDTPGCTAKVRGTATKS